VGALARNHADDRGRIEHRGEQHGSACGEAAEHQHRAARGVEKWHVVNERISGVETGARHRVVAVANEAVVMEQRAFRKAGGAGGVLDLRRIPGLR
jgi:hypothetical protein